MVSGKDDVQHSQPTAIEAPVEMRILYPALWRRICPMELQADDRIADGRIDDWIQGGHFSYLSLEQRVPSEHRW